MSIDFDIQDNDSGWDDIMDSLTDRSARFVDVGIMASEGEEIIKIAAAHEFGATIDHPGGTPFGYETEEDAEAGRVRFLGRGEGFMVIGETQPHIIDIPERSFIRGTIDQKEKDIADKGHKLAEAMFDGKISKRQALEIWGDIVQTLIRNGITSGSLNLEPNAPSTIAKKGSDTPLVDTGHLLGSIKYELVP